MEESLDYMKINKMNVGKDPVFVGKYSDGRNVYKLYDSYFIDHEKIESTLLSMSEAEIKNYESILKRPRTESNPFDANPCGP